MTKVAAVQTAVRAASQAGRAVRVYRGASNSTRSYGEGLEGAVDVSNFTSIIEINSAKGYVWVEPNVALDQLVDALLPHGVVPPVVAEFPGITVGGAVQGGSGESSSFKYGGFHTSCLAYEVVLGDGTVKTVTPRSDATIFWGLGCAFGSLGILTMVKIKLVPATKYVRLQYRRQTGVSAAIEQIQAAVNEPVDFVDSIVFSANQASVMVGTYTDDSDDLPLATFHRARDEWFYLHAQNITSQHDSYTELIPLRDYLFRYDRGGFWAAKYGFQQLHVPFTRLTRFALARGFKTRTLYKLLHGSGYAYEVMTQDLCMPQETIGELIDYTQAAYDITPLWLCPLLPAQNPNDSFSPAALQTKLVINLGLWGIMKSSPQSAMERNRQLEHLVARLGGRKVLYAHAYYTEEEFWRIYNKSLYKTLRKQTHSETVFPDMYQKVVTRPPARKPSILRGIKALFVSPYHRPTTKA